MSAESVLTGLCTYFGGAYDPATRSYRTPRVAGLGAVRGSYVKKADLADFYLGMPEGTATGAQLVVALPSSTEKRIAVPAVLGWKEVRWTVELNFFLVSNATYSEDATAAFYALRDAVLAHIHADPACGSGGYEAGGFQVGEGAPITTDLAQGDARAQQIEAVLLVKCIAIENIQA